MTETEYIRATNLTKLRLADHALRQVLDGKNWGVLEAEIKQALMITSKMIERLEKLVTTEGE